MATFTFYTSLYSQELAGFLIPFKNKILDTGEVEGLHFFCVGELCPEKEFAGKLAELIKEIVLLNNPVVRASAKLHRSIGARVFVPGSEAIVLELYDFLQNNESLNLDGYIQFMMRDYSEKINMILYSVVKKNFDSLYDLADL